MDFAAISVPAFYFVFRFLAKGTEAGPYVEVVKVVNKVCQLHCSGLYLAEPTLEDLLLDLTFRLFCFLLRPCLGN